MYVKPLNKSLRDRLCISLVCFSIGFLSWSDLMAETGWFSFQNGGSNTNSKAIEIDQTVQFNKRWEVVLEGYGQSSPVVWDKTIYTTTVLGKNKETCIVAAHDLASGKRLWRLDFKNPAPRESTVYVSKAATTPVVDEDGIVATFEGGLLVSCSHEGKVSWKRDLLGEFGELSSNHGLSSSLEQTQESVFVWVERKEAPYILSVDKKSGKNNWIVSGVGSSSWATPRWL